MKLTYYLKQCVALFLFSTMAVVAQDRPVQGTVTDDAGVPLPGATVVVLETNQGTTTDFDGNYSITVAEGQTVAISFVGYSAYEVTVSENSDFNIALQEDSLEEVVVTALGIKRAEKTLSYASQTVKAEELTQARDINFANSLTGRAAGVEIRKNSSGAGGSTRIVLRGNKSLSGNSEPLIVIDGVPMVNNKGGQPGMWGGIDEGDVLSQINPDDIESVNILKGANASILYGSQGANGVVLITTKSGVEGEAKVTINSGTPFDYDDVVEKGAVNDFVSRISATVAWNEAGSNEEKLEKIITQKWIAAYTNSIEAWVDHRRTGYPKLPYNYQNDSNSDFGVIADDDFMKRMVFPVGERTSNAKGYTDAVSKLGGPDEIGTRLYWDTGGSNF